MTVVGARCIHPSLEPAESLFGGAGANLDTAGQRQDGTEQVASMSHGSHIHTQTHLTHMNTQGSFRIPDQLINHVFWTIG